MQRNKPELILASQSAIRKLMLANAGLEFKVMPAFIDERSEKKAMRKLAPQTIAKKLAALKAASVSAKFRDALVIGSDQTLELKGKLFDKPLSHDDARKQLMTLRGKTHSLHSAISCFAAGKEVWKTGKTAKLTMRNFSDDFLNEYLESQGDDVLTSVGGYKIEGPGLQLFSKIGGDYFTILGMPLLPLFAFLRVHNVIAT
jgi:septum formation protein